MPDETIDLDRVAQRYESALAEFGFTNAHASALTTLIPDADECEALAVHVAHHLIPLDPATNLRPYITLWVSVLTAALHRRHPQAAEQPVTLAAQALVLLAVVLDPATLPPLDAPPPLLKAVDQPGRRWPPR